MGSSALRLFAFLLLFASAPVWAAGDGPGTRPVVREGTTQLDAPSAAAPAPDEQPITAAAPLPSSVVDAPRVAAGALRMPPTPPGFNTYDVGWLTFVYHPSSRERVQPLIAVADRVRAELSARLGFPTLSGVRVEIARTPGEMATFAPSGAPYPEYAAGVAYPDLRLVLLSQLPVHAAAEQDLGEVFRHELAHVALGDALNGQPVPRWFNEGFAVFASGETSFARMKTLSMATVGGSLIPLHDIERSFPGDETQALVAYAEAVDVVRFLVRREDAHRFRALVAELRGGKGFERAVLDAYGVDLGTLELEWRDDVSRRYTFWPILLSGTFFWVIALAVFVWGWRRRKRRDRATLKTWARQEAAEDLLRARLARRSEAERVHIVLATGTEVPVGPLPPPRSEVEVPTVEHDGQTHTLH